MVRVGPSAVGWLASLPGAGSTLSSLRICQAYASVALGRFLDRVTLTRVAS